jgi:hypothetical protein
MTPSHAKLIVPGFGEKEVPVGLMPQVSAQLFTEYVPGLGCIQYAFARDRGSPDSNLFYLVSCIHEYDPQRIKQRNINV